MLRKLLRNILIFISPTYRQTNYLLTEISYLRKSIEYCANTMTANNNDALIRECELKEALNNLVVTILTESNTLEQSIMVGHEHINTFKKDVEQRLAKISNKITNIEKRTLSLPLPDRSPQQTEAAQYGDIKRPTLTLQKMLHDYEFDTVLDIGCGAGHHTKILIDNGKKVTAVDYERSPGFVLNDFDDFIIGDFMQLEFGSRQFDAVWCSHVLEHMPNTNLFLRKVYSVLKEGGVLALSVPPLKHDIVGGHVHLFNAGILLYHLVLAGFDCSNAAVKSYGYNISVLVTKRTINVLPDLIYDSGDINTIKKFLPLGLDFLPQGNDVKFNGSIESLNWE